RSAEIAVRRALGVSRGRLAEQLSVESGLLALCGAVVALAFAWWGAGAMRALILPRVQWRSLPLTPRTVAVVALTTIGIALLGGLLPAAQALKADVVDALRAGARTVSRAGSSARTWLLVMQVALTMVLLVGASLFARSLDNVRDIGVGYQTTDRW